MDGEGTAYVEGDLTHLPKQIGFAKITWRSLDPACVNDKGQVFRSGRAYFEAIISLPNGKLETKWFDIYFSKKPINPWG